MRHILIMGICGTGKSTVAERLADRLSCPMIEADAHHTPEAIAKMASGEALVDDDRWSWLDRVVAAAVRPGVGTVIACSALKATYRARLAQGLGPLGIVYLHGSPSLVTERMGQRTGHYMPSSLVATQLADLEPPAGRDVLPLDIAQPLDDMVAAAHDFATPMRKQSHPHIPLGGLQ